MQTDAMLVQAVLGGNRTAYAELVRRYERPVCAAAWAILRDSHAAQDVAQDTFVKAYFKLSSLTQPEAFGAWILATARRVALSAARSAPQPVGAVPWSHAAAVETPEADERTSLVLAAVARLPDHEQRAVMLRFIDGRTVAEIAVMTGHPVGTVTKQLSRALARLRENLKGMS